MTAVISVAWQPFRLGLHVSTIRRAGLATLWETLDSSVQSKQHFRNIHGFHKCSPISSFQTCNVRPTNAFCGSVPPFGEQARCASLWKRKSESEEPQWQKASENEVFPRSRAEINAIFGLKIDRRDGNDLLRRLQEHRHRGTLDQKLPYPNALIDKGLKYLRVKFPLDEDAAIIARIDREADGELRLPQTNIDQSPQAVSQFEKLRRENKKRRDKERAKYETEVQKGVVEESPKAERRVTVRDGTALVELRPEPEWVQRYRDKAQMKEIPEISVWARLIPSGLVTVAVVTLAVLFAQNYQLPSRNARLWPDLPPAAATIISLIGINIAVLVLWRLPPFWKFLNRNFLVVPAYPHSISMLTACFSHQSFPHLLSNMVSIWLIGTRRMSTPIIFSLILNLTVRNST